MIVEVVDEVTLTVFTVNVVEVLPEAIVTVAGTVAIEAEADRVITKPVLGAGDVTVTVAVLDLPPTTDVGLRVTDFTVGGLRVKVAVGEAAPNFAVMVAVFCTETAEVFTVKVVDVFPDGTVTEEDTVADVIELLSLTTIPPAPAGPVKVTVPVDVTPPTTTDGLSVTDVSDGGLIDNAAVSTAFPFLAVIVTSL